MKKFLKLCLAVAALATMFGFASCSNDSSNDSTTTPATKTVKTTTVKIGDTEYSYTETDGKVDTSDKIKVADDGSITVTVADGSKVTISKDGKTITYTDKNGKVYTGQLGGESITLKSSDGTEVTASAAEKTEKKTVPTTPAATPAAANAFAGKTFVSDEGKVIFVFASNGKVIFAQNKEKIFTETYTVTGNDFTFTVAGQNKISGSLSGTTLTAGDAAHGNGTFAQTSGTNGFAGKSFMTSDGSKIIVFVSDTKVVLGGDKGNFHSIDYTVSGGKATAEGFEATLSDKTLTVKTTKHGEDHTDTGILVE